MQVYRVVDMRFVAWCLHIEMVATCAGKSPDEMNFFRTLRVEIKKIADFFVQEQAKHTNQVAAIEQISNELKVMQCFVQQIGRCVAF